jgi:hypothetical protein
MDTKLRNNTSATIQINRDSFFSGKTKPGKFSIQATRLKSIITR